MELFSPVVVDEGVDLDIVAKRICWGKWLNNGQTCLAPDYVMVREQDKTKVRLNGIGF